MYMYVCVYLCNVHVWLYVACIHEYELVHVYVSLVFMYVLYLGVHIIKSIYVCAVNMCAFMYIG